MTTEEAIKQLNAWAMQGYAVPVVAIHMAIEALDRETRKYDAIYDELVELKNDLTLPLEVAMAYEKSIAVVKKYARIGESDG